MTLAKEELEAAKGYMRIDGDEDDLVVTQCVLAARAYLAGAGVSLPAPDTQRRVLYDLTCHAVALSLYDHRDGMTEEALRPNAFLQRQINQLKLTEPVSELDIGGEEG